MCEECDWEDLAIQIEEMQEESRFDWAHDTLQGILEWVSENEHCTEGQKDAINNIEGSAR